MTIRCKICGDMPLTYVTIRRRNLCINCARKEYKKKLRELAEEYKLFAQKNENQQTSKNVVTSCIGLKDNHNKEYLLCENCGIDVEVTPLGECPRCGADLRACQNYNNLEK